MLTILFVVTIFAISSNAQVHRIVFAANFNSQGGVHREDHSGADLYSVDFDPILQQVSQFTRLTFDTTSTEWFPSLSPDGRWVAYNYQKNIRNEVRLLDLETGLDILVQEDARFPEWMGEDALLVSKSVAGTTDVFRIKLDYSSPAPTVIQDERLTNRINCPNTSLAEDPYPFPDGQSFIFHTIRSSLPAVPAAIAGLGIDGTGFATYTDWDGSGHGIVNSNGDEIVASLAGSGEAVVVQLSAGDTTTQTLPLPQASAEGVDFDSRFAGVNSMHWTYAAWAGDDRSLLFSVQGASSSNEYSFSRMIHVAFDNNWENPSFFDISSAIEILSGQAGRDFCTASYWALPEFQDEKGKVYVTLFLGSGNPDNPNYPDYAQDGNRPLYAEARENLVDFCEMMHSYDAPFSWMPNWNFLLGVLKWDDAELMAMTDGKNVVRYISENLGFTVGAHCHENVGYNYADNCHLVDSLGVMPSNVVGGHIWDPNDSEFQNWEKFRTPQQGQAFPHASWQAAVLTLHATSGHSADPEPSGVWKPQDRNNFWTHDPSVDLVAVGQYDYSMEGIRHLVGLYDTGVVSEDQILTATLSYGQSQLDETFVGHFEQSVLQPLLDMQNRGEIILADYNQVVDQWNALYDSLGHVYNAPDETGISSAENLPVKFGLLQNYPNPFNPETTIQYHLGQPGHVMLSVYDMMGEEVIQLVNEKSSPGRYEVHWGGRDKKQTPVASGVYFSKLTIKTITGQAIQRLNKMILMK